MNVWQFWFIVSWMFFVVILVVSLNEEVTVDELEQRCAEIMAEGGLDYIDTSLEEILCASVLGPDTWQEGDLGDMIWQAMEELGTCEK